MNSLATGIGRELNAVDDMLMIVNDSDNKILVVTALVAGNVGFDFLEIPNDDSLIFRC